MSVSSGAALQNPDIGGQRRKRPFFKVLLRDVRRSPSLYVILAPVIAYYLLFAYKPMSGALIAFMDYIPGFPLWESEWVGFSNFVDFFRDPNAFSVIRNTFVISVSSIVWGFPVPIVFALLLNELRNRRFMRVVQTVSYLPHFISLVVICGLLRTFVTTDGAITGVLYRLGLVPNESLLNSPANFVPLYVVSGIWQEFGYGAIVYIAALLSINTELYEAARIDGCGRAKQVWHISLPGIAPTIIAMLLLRLGQVMNVGFEKVMLLYSPLIYETADVLSTFVYRKGLQEMNFSFSTAVGLFNSTCNFLILMIANTVSKRTSGNSLW
ncbi:MAG: ABC transporter permease subunit [Clostridiales bacterium]|jgi:putative aldouronate transport system permease protein|nr:ABC transporter permease subunit [Clostridiales bacterium]